MRVARWSPFTATTPQGRRLARQICDTNNAGPLAGALMVERIDGQPCGRIMLYGMPEIPYHYEGRVHTHGALSVTVSRKLDGTAIMFSPLFCKGEYLATICRTRGVPVLVNMRPPKNQTDAAVIGGAMAAQRYRQWVDLIGRVAALEAIEGLCRSQRATLVFELHGRENPHCVDCDTDLDMRLNVNTLDLVAAHVAIARFRLETRAVTFDRYTQIGFVGTVTYRIVKRRRRGDELVRRLDILADYAPFCGTGHKTTQGMGQTRRLYPQ